MQMTRTLNSEELRVLCRALDYFLWTRAPRDERERRPHDRAVARELLTAFRYGPLDVR